MEDDLATFAESPALELQRARTRVTLLEALVGVLSHHAFVTRPDGAARFADFEASTRKTLADILAQPDFMGAHPVRQDAAFYLEEVLAKLRPAILPPP